MPSRRVPGQSGFTLIEVLIAISLAGILTTALSTGILFLFRANATITEDQQLQRVLGNLAESIKSLDYVTCDDPALAGGVDEEQVREFYVDELVGATILEQETNLAGDPVLKPAPDWRPTEGVTVDIVDVKFWEKVTFVPVTAPSTSPPGPGAFRDSCPVDRFRSGASQGQPKVVGGQQVVIDDGVQLVTLEARLGSRSVRVQVVKADRNDVAPAGGP